MSKFCIKCGSETMTEQHDAEYNADTGDKQFYCVDGIRTFSHYYDDWPNTIYYLRLWPHEDKYFAHYLSTDGDALVGTFSDYDEFNRACHEKGLTFRAQLNNKDLWYHEIQRIESGEKN